MSFPHPIGRLAKLYRELRRRLPVTVSALALNEFKANFRQQGYKQSGESVTKWEKRKKDTEKDKGRGLLIKSGRLRRSLRPNPTADMARVSTNVPYAQIHNEGGTISKTVSVKAHLRKRIVIKSHQRKMNTEITARPFMITTDNLTAKINKHIEDGITKAFNQA